MPAPLCATRSVLLVEDHADTAEVLDRLFECDGHRFTLARTLDEARRILEDRSFDVVFCDLGLPDGSGLVLPAEFKAAHANTKFVALTGHVMPPDMLNIEAAGFDAHVLKPCEFDQLLEHLG
jgi:CheY-like chemotaxis protein